MAIKITLAYEDISSVQELFDEYVQWLGMDLSFQNYDEERNTLPGKYDCPEGRLYIAYLDQSSAGCVALRKFDQERCEMKRLYVREQFRGCHIGQLLVQRIIEDAIQIGYQSMLLDTLSCMPEARSLYIKMGFEQIEPYYYNPLDNTFYFEKDLKIPAVLAGSPGEGRK